MTFGEWFVAQHGQRPSARPTYEIAKSIEAAQHELSRLQSLYRACELWDEQAKSALYAWNIADKDKAI